MKLSRILGSIRTPLLLATGIFAVSSRTSGVTMSYPEPQPNPQPIFYSADDGDRAEMEKRAFGDFTISPAYFSSSPKPWEKQEKVDDLDLYMLSRRTRFTPEIPSDPNTLKKGNSAAGYGLGDAIDMGREAYAPRGVSSGYVAEDNSPYVPGNPVVPEPATGALVGLGALLARKRE